MPYMALWVAAAASIEAKNDSSSPLCSGRGRRAGKMKRNIHEIIVMYCRDYTQPGAGILHNTIFPGGASILL